MWSTQRIEQILSVISSRVVTAGPSRCSAHSRRALAPPLCPTARAPQHPSTRAGTGHAAPRAKPRSCRPLTHSAAAPCPRRRVLAHALLLPGKGGERQRGGGWVRRAGGVGKIDNIKFKFRTRFNMMRIKPSIHDSNKLDSTNIINMISENMIMNWI